MRKGSIDVGHFSLNFLCFAMAVDGERGRRRGRELRRLDLGVCGYHYDCAA